MLQGEFVVLELDWRRKGASNAEIRKRLGKAASVRKLAEEQEGMAKAAVLGPALPHPLPGAFLRGRFPGAFRGVSG